MPTIRTIERRPQQAGAARPPLLLMLHGYGSNERDLMAFAPYLDPRLHIVAARGLLNIGFGYAWYHLRGGPGDLRPDPVTRAEALETLQKFVADLPGRLGTDPGKTFVLGFSQGAILSLALALSAPESLAGVIPLSGYLDPELAPTLNRQRLAALDVLMLHGELDDVIPVAAARASRDYLAGTPARLLYREYPIGHSVHPDGVTLIREWLAERIDRPAREAL